LVLNQNHFILRLDQMYMMVNVCVYGNTAIAAGIYVIAKCKWQIVFLSHSGFNEKRRWSFAAVHHSSDL